MSILDDLAVAISDYKQANDLKIRNKTDAWSITKENVADQFSDLADLIQQFFVLLGGGGSGTYETLIPDGTRLADNVGELLAGTDVATLRHQTFAAIFDRMFYKTVPILNNPTATLSLSPSGIFKVGSTQNFSGMINFGRGSILQPWNNNQAQGFRSGAASAYHVIMPGLTDFEDLQTPNFSLPNFVVPRGISHFQGKVDYAAGPQPLDLNGNNYGTPYPAGTMLTEQENIEGVLPFFATTADIGVLTEQPLVSESSANLPFTLTGETYGSTNRQRFAIPKNFGGPGRGVVKIQYYDVVSQSWDSADRSNDFSKTATQETVLGTAYDYYLYTYDGSYRDNILILVTLG